MEMTVIAWMLGVVAAAAGVTLYFWVIGEVMSAVHFGTVERWLWIAAIFFVPLFGFAAWFLVGRDRARGAPTSSVS